MSTLTTLDRQLVSRFINDSLNIAQGPAKDAWYQLRKLVADPHQQLDAADRASLHAFLRKRADGAEKKQDIQNIELLLNLVAGVAPAAVPVPPAPPAPAPAVPAAERKKPGPKARPKPAAAPAPPAPAVAPELQQVISQVKQEPVPVHELPQPVVPVAPPAPAPEAPAPAAAPPALMPGELLLITPDFALPEIRLSVAKSAIYFNKIAQDSLLLKDGTRALFACKPGTKEWFLILNPSSSVGAFQLHIGSSQFMFTSERTLASILQSLGRTGQNTTIPILPEGQPIYGGMAYRLDTANARTPAGNKKGGNAS